MFIHFSDTSIPLGKRKQAYVKWLMRKHKLKLKDAKLACARKFNTLENWIAEDARIKHKEGWE